MKPQGRYHSHLQGVIKDSLIITLTFVVFCFIDLEVATFMGIVCTVLLLTRRSIRYYNRGVLAEPNDNLNKNQTVLPKGADVFHLGETHTMNDLRYYTEVICGILRSPRILIIRFGCISYIEEYDLFLLTEILCQLQKSGICVILSDVGKSILLQLNEFGIEQKLGTNNIFSNYDDAMIHAREILHNLRISIID